MRGLLDFHSVQWKSTDSPTFSIFTIKKKRNPCVVKVNQFTTKFKSVFDSQIIRCIFVWHTIDLDVFISVWKQIYYSCTFQYVHIYLYLIYAYRVRNNTSFIIVNPITMDSIIFVGIDFRKLKKKMASCGYSISWFVEFYQIIFYRIIE